MTFKEIGEAIKDLQSQVSQLLTGKNAANAEQVEAAKVDFEARIGELQSELNGLAVENEKLNGAIADLEADNEKLTTELEEAKASHQVEIKETQSSVDEKASKKASEIAASQGIPPVSIKPDGEVSIGKSVSERYAEITNPKEKVAFYRKHKRELIKANR